MNIVLCGMMGAGKSSVGRRIARLMHREWLDTDRLIADKYGKISDIFAQHGEAYFRALETETVRELAEKDGLVISTGGGLVLATENVELLKRNGKIIFLRASAAAILSRVRDDGSRPLLSGEGREERLNVLLKERTPVYERVADYIVNTDGKSVDRVAREILARIKE